MNRYKHNIGENELLLSHAAIKIREKQHWSKIIGKGIPSIISDKAIRELIYRNNKPQKLA